MSGSVATARILHSASWLFLNPWPVLFFPPCNVTSVTFGLPVPSLVGFPCHLEPCHGLPILRPLRSCLGRGDGFLPVTRTSGNHPPCCSKYSQSTGDKHHPDRARRVRNE